MLEEASAGWPSVVTEDLDADAVVLDDDEIRERMSGNLCRCAAYANIVPAIARGGAVRPFRYERAADASDAVALLQREPNAAFLAGGTNLVDHMKLGIATPDLLVDVRRVTSPVDRGAARRTACGSGPA